MDGVQQYPFWFLGDRITLAESVQPRYLERQPFLAELDDLYIEEPSCSQSTRLESADPLDTDRGSQNSADTCQESS